MRRWLANVVVAALLLLVTGNFIGAGVRGVGFGTMWDEVHQLDGLRHSVETVSVSQVGYYYGGLYYVPGYLLLAPKLLRKLPEILEEMRNQPSRPFAANQYPTLVAFQHEATEAIGSGEFLERDRRLFVWLVALTIPSTFGACYLMCGSRFAALCGAAALGLSWELSYHGRFVAVDALLGLFGSLVLLGIAAALSAATPRAERRYFRLAAMAAGCGMGCKIPGLFLLIPVLAAQTRSLEGGGVWAWCKRALESCFLAAALFVAICPGVVLDPIHYANDLFRVASDYNGIANDYPFCEPLWRRRALKILEYLGTVVWSHYLPAACALTLLMVLGAAVGLRERRMKVLSVLCFLVAYVGFVSSQRLLIVRNLMVTLPSLAVLLSVGLSTLADLADRYRGGRVALVGGFVSVAALNTSWLWQTATSVGTTTEGTILQGVAEHLLAHPADRIYVAPALLERLRPAGAPNASRLASTPWSEAKQVMMNADALPDWRANTPRRATYFGSMHGNYDYYPGLLLSPLVMLLSKERASELGVKSAPAR